MFIDKKNWFEALVNPDYTSHSVDGIPQPYDYHKGNRAPLVCVGHTGFEKLTGKKYFAGPRNVSKDSYPLMKHFVREFNRVKDKLPPAAYVFAQNENWVT